MNILQRPLRLQRSHIYHSVALLRALAGALLIAATASGCGSREDATDSAASLPPADPEAAIVQAVTAASSVRDFDGASAALQRMPEQLDGVERGVSSSSVSYGDAALEVLPAEQGLPTGDPMQERVDTALTRQGATVARRCTDSGLVCATGAMPSGGHAVVWVPEGSQLVFAAIAPSAEQLAALTQSFAGAAK